MENTNINNNTVLKKTGMVLGPVVFLILLIFFDPDPVNRHVGATAAVAALMAIWWITETVPLAITAILPVALFPLLGIMDGREVSSTYFNHVIFLFIGGFIVALAMQKWELHRRIALYTLTVFSLKPKRILLGFMVTTAFLSMWISNTATAMMMVPIALSVLINLEEKLDAAIMRKYSIALLLGIAYGASIGGIATLVGTPPNLSFVRILNIAFPMAPEISFASWFFFALPLSVVFLILAWLILSAMFIRRDFKVEKKVLDSQRASLGKISFEEKVVLVIFISLALLWLTRSDISFGNLTMPGWSRMFPSPSYINDGVVAISLALILYFIPSKSGGRLMDWETTAKLPWNIVLLFGGGFALASGFVASGLSEWLGGQFAGISSLPVPLIIGSISLMVTFMTELTSNTATAEMILPVLGSLGVAIGKNPLIVMVPATIAASCAFMMPVATPPNAIIFGTNRIRIIDMVKAGLILNLLGVILITLTILIMGPVLGIDPSVMPGWADY